MVSILIVNWNGQKHLETCLSSLATITYKNAEVIVVDQGSSDGSVAYLKKHFKKVRIVELIENTGFAKGNNLGLEHVSGELVLLLNNDTKVEPDFLEPLVQVVQKKGVAVVQPKICFWDKKQIQSAGSFMTTTGFLYHRGYGADKIKYQAQGKIFSANGACMLVKKNIAEKLGLFDEDYFAYLEETDFCWRVWLAGYEVIYEPGSVIYHKGGQTSQVFTNAHVQHLAFRNRINTILKNLGFNYLLWILPIHLGLCVLNAIVFLSKSKASHSYAVFGAIFWNLTHLENTLKKRRIIQNARKISDRSLFQIIVKNPKLNYYYYLFTDLKKYEKH